MSGELLPFVVDGAISLVALVVAVLMFTQFRVVRVSAVLALACGFLLMSLATMPQLLREAVGAIADPRLRFIADLVLPVAAIAYALLLRVPSDTLDVARAASLVAGGVAATVTLAALITWSTATHIGPLTDAPVAAAFPLFPLTVAMALLWRRRGSTLDLGLLVALSGCAIGVLLRAVVADGTSLTGQLLRLFDLFGVASLMFLLLAENAALYSRLVSLIAGRPVAEGREQARSDTASVVSGIADQLNQPLCAITANADAIGRMLEQERPDLAEVRAALEDIVGDARRASETMRHSQRVLADAREAPSAIDVGQLLGDCLHQLRPALSLQRVTCEVLTAEQLPVVRGSRRQLQQMLVDLVTHALEAMHGAQPRERRLRVRASRHDAGAVAIWVEDPASLGTLPPSHSRLAFCHTVVNAHGGHISVAAGERGGATFKVVLPASS